jgi:predicted transcriptional regulator
MIVKVVGDVEAKNEYGYVGAIPRGEYEVTVSGLVFFKGTINKWTLFLSTFQKAVEENKIKIISL